MSGQAYDQMLSVEIDAPLSQSMTVTEEEQVALRGLHGGGEGAGGLKIIKT